MAAAATSFQVSVWDGSSIDPAARVGSSPSPPVSNAHAVDGRPLSSVAASHARARSVKLRRPLGNESRDAFTRVRTARLLDDRLRLELHLCLERLAEAVQEQALRRA